MGDVDENVASIVKNGLRITSPSTEEFDTLMTITPTDIAVPLPVNRKVLLSIIVACVYVVVLVTPLVVQVMNAVPDVWNGIVLIGLLNTS